MSELRMPSINQVALSGRLVQDPEFRITESGVARLAARIAVNRAYRDRNDEWQEESSFFNIVLWSRLAEALSDRLRKGTPVFLSGRLHSHSWRDDDETPHYIVDVQVRHLQVLDRAAAAPGEVATEEVATEEVATEEVEELDLAA